MPDERTQAMRRRLQRRSQLVRGSSAAKNEIHAALMRRLVPKPAFSDLFGKAGRSWLTRIELPAAERESVDSCLRQLAFLESEIEAIDRVVAQEALGSPKILRLMTVPGVGATTAAAFMAAVGDISRFSSPKRLVAYLGLDPIVRQSGSGEAAYGRISKRGSAAGRYALVEACWSVVKAPGPLRSFTSGPRAGEEPRSRSWPPRASSPASAGRCSAATRTTPTGSPRCTGASCAWHASPESRQAEREIAEQAEAAYRRNVAEFKRVEAARAKQRKEAEKVGAGATSGRAS